MKTYNENLHGNTKPFIYENAKYLRHTQTKAEKLLWKNLRGRKLMSLKFRRQHPYENFILDFYCHERKLCIEVDGSIHDIERVKEYDENRTRLLNENEIRVIRFTNEEIINNTEAVFNKIIESLNKK